VILKIKHAWTERKADVQTWFPVLKAQYIKHPPPPFPPSPPEWQRAIQAALSESELKRKRRTFAFNVAVGNFSEMTKYRLVVTEECVVMSRS
jgi:hypothetical protein